MIFGLFAFLIGIALVLVLVGIFRRGESGFALIGFTLFFILSMIMVNGNLQLESGVNMSTSFSYTDGYITSSTQTMDYRYTDWDNSTSHQIGFWLAIASAIGFIIMLFSIRGLRKNDEE